MQAHCKIAGRGIQVVLWCFLLLLPISAHAQAATAQLKISLTVQSSITLVFNNNPSVGAPGFCPLTNAGTSNVGLELGGASFPANVNSTCGNYTHLTGSFYQVSSAFDVLVTKFNSSSPTYRLDAQISSAPPQGVIWLIDNIALSNAAFTPLTTTNNYGQPVTKTLQVQVRNNVPAQVLQETITFLATAN